MKLTVLIENTAPPHLIHEHGLSLHLTHGGHSILLDAGATGRFTENADALGVDLAGVEYAVLSHGHYDHADGLGAFLALNGRARVYARPAVTSPWYHSNEDGSQRFVGVNPALFSRYAGRFDFADGPRLVCPGVHLIPDAVEHEQSLVAETPEGLVVINSCCHAGAGCLTRDILARFPGRRVRALLGGFHLVGNGGMRSLGVAPGIVRNLAHWLTDELGVEDIYTGHCTGIPAYDLLAEETGARLHHLTTGLTLEF